MLAPCTTINVVSRGVDESFPVFLLPVAEAFAADRGAQTGIFGGILFGMGTGGALGAWGSGSLFDLTGGYGASFVLSAVAAACGLALFQRVPGLAGSQARRTGCAGSGSSGSAHPAWPRPVAQPASKCCGRRPLTPA